MFYFYQLPAEITGQCWRPDTCMQTTIELIFVILILFLSLHSSHSFGRLRRLWAKINLNNSMRVQYIYMCVCYLCISFSKQRFNFSTRRGLEPNNNATPFILSSSSSYKKRKEASKIGQSNNQFHQAPPFSPNRQGEVVIRAHLLSLLNSWENNTLHIQTFSYTQVSFAPEREIINVDQHHWYLALVMMMLDSATYHGAH